MNQIQRLPHRAILAGSCTAFMTLSACGGGTVPGTSTSTGSSSTPVQLSAASPAAWATGPCGMATAGLTGEGIQANSAVQPQVAARPGLPTQLFAIWEQDRWTAIGARGAMFSASTDGGATWNTTPLALPFSTCTSGVVPGSQFDRISDPSITAGSGVVLASVLAFSASGYEAPGGKSAVLVARSADGGLTWSTPVAVISDTGSSTGPWHFNDRDAIAMDPNSSHVYLVWDRLTTDTAASSPTWLAHSADGGLTWDASRLIFDPGTMNQTFNNQPVVLPDGSVVNVFSLANGFGATLTAIRSADHGLTWTAPGGTLAGGSVSIATMAPVATVNPVAGGAPVRDSPYMAQVAVDPSSGAIAAVWQESSFSSGARNGIAFTISTDKGVHWSAPVQVNGRTDLQAFDPSVHFSGAGKVAVTYYDFRDCGSGCSTAALTGVWMRVSTDNGHTWGADVRVAGPFDLLYAPPTDQLAGTVGNALFLGDQQGLAWNGSAWVSVLATSGASGTHVQSVTTR